MTEMTETAALIGRVALTVSDLDRSVDFYRAKLGLTLQQREGNTARLGSGVSTWLELTAVPGARKIPRTSGLYHFAILLPSRFELAQLLRRLAETDAPIQGVADHGVSEAIYLADPDGTGIELYRDRPQAEWPRDEEGRLVMGTDELDLDGLVSELGEQPPAWDGLPAGTRVGHVHLHVSNLARAEIFYTGVIGLKLTQRYGPSAAFLSYGGYHHHVGINTWAGAGVPAAPAGSAGLRWYEIRLPSQDALRGAGERARSAGLPVEESPQGLFLTDPSQNGILLSAS